LAPQWLRNQLENKHYVMGNVYGTHLPLRLKMEMNILSQAARLPGIRSSHTGLNTILGRDETIDFEDYLGGAPLAFPHGARIRRGIRLVTRGRRVALATQPRPPFCMRSA
jgi:hypothetical protein